MTSPPPLPSPLEREGWVGGTFHWSFGIGALVAMFTGLVIGFYGDFKGIFRRPKELIEKEGN